MTPWDDDCQSIQGMNAFTDAKYSEAERHEHFTEQRLLRVSWLLTPTGATSKGPLEPGSRAPTTSNSLATLQKATW